MVVLRDLAGNVHYMRNGQIEVVTNMTKTFSRCTEIRFPHVTLYMGQNKEGRSAPMRVSYTEKSGDDLHGNDAMRLRWGRGKGRKKTR
jgi:hypothetical protein